MIRALLATGHDVLVDDTHTTIHSVKQLWTIDKTAQYMIIDSTLEKCEGRAVKCGMTDLLPAIRRMFPQFREIKALLLNHYSDLNYLGGQNVISN